MWTWIVYTACLIAAIWGWLLLSRGNGSLLGTGYPGFLWNKASLKLYFTQGWKRTSVWRVVERLLRERNRSRAEWEISEAISYMRNAVAMGRGERMSTGLVLEELSELSGILAPAYFKMLQYLRLNEREKMAETLETASGCDAGRDFARLLLQWEELPPAMLAETLTSYQENLRELRVTRQKKRDELVSDVIYLPVIMNVMLVLVNFIYVAYFIDQREMLFNMFS